MKKKNILYLNLFAIAVFAVLVGIGVVDTPGLIGGLSLLPFAFGMGIERVAGTPDYETSGADKRIPWIFSKKTVVKFYDKSICPFTSNSEYTGDITGMGSKVIIQTVPNVAVSKYKKGMDINWEQLSSPAVELDINRAIYTAFKFDKIDLKQFALKMMDKCSEDAAEQVKVNIDEEYLGDIYASAAAANKGIAAGRKSASYNLGTTGSAIALTKSNIIDYLMMCEAVADEQNWPTSDRWIALPTWATFLLNTSDLKDASLTGEDKSILVKGGKIGKVGNFTVLNTNLYTAVETNRYNITFGHMSGVCFAAQLTEMEFHEKFEKTFGSGMKGLKVYDWKVIKPESIGVLYAYKG